MALDQACADLSGHENDVRKMGRIDISDAA